MLPGGVSGRRRREAVFDLAAVEVRERAFDGVALGVAQGAVDVLPFGVQLAEFFGDRAGFVGVLVVIVPPSGKLAGAAFVAGGGGAEVAAGVVREAPLGVAAGVELGGVAGPRQGVVGQFRPARPLALGRVGQPVALAVDRVEFGRLAAEFALGGNVAGRQQDVGVPVAVVPAKFGVDLLMLVGVSGEFGVADRPGRVQGHVGRHLVAVGQLAGETDRQFLPLLGAQFAGEGDLDFAGQDGVVPFVVVL